MLHLRVNEVAFFGPDETIGNIFFFFEFWERGGGEPQEVILYCAQIINSGSEIKYSLANCEINSP